MNLLINVVQTEAPHFVDLELPAINTSNELGVLGTTSTRIKRLRYGYHWTMLDHVLGKKTAVGISLARSDQDYSYKTDFKNLEGKLGI